MHGADLPLQSHKTNSIVIVAGSLFLEVSFCGQRLRFCFEVKGANEPAIDRQTSQESGDVKG